MALGLARAGMAGRSACGMGPGGGALLRGAWGPWWLLARVCIQVRTTQNCVVRTRLLARVCIQAFFGLRAGAASASCYQLNSICQQRRALVQCAHGFGSPNAKAQQPLASMGSAAFLLPTCCACGSALRRAVWGLPQGGAGSFAPVFQPRTACHPQGRRVTVQKL